MSEIPKPKPCFERWANMTPAEGGRICQSCSKLIVDFRKKSWNEISKLQSENNSSICGIYSNKQLKHWGQEPPTKLNFLKKTAGMVAFSSVLSVVAHAQTEPSKTHLVVYGVVSSSYFSKEKQKNVDEPIENAEVVIESLSLQTKTDTLGAFSIKVPKTLLHDSILELTTKAESFEEKKLTINTNQATNDSLNANQNLFKSPILLESPTINMFYAAPPTFKESIKEKLDTLKGKK